MTTLQELMAKAATLDAQIRTLQSEQRASALAQVRALMEEHGLTSADLAEESSKSKPARTRKASGKTSGKVAAKYPSPEGDSWSGRGLQPRWLKAALHTGKKIEDFAV